MRVVTLKDIPILPVEGAAEQTAGWTGPVSRSRQTIVPPGDSPNYNCSVVHFSQGCNTGWHTHDCDQLLIVTSGAGYVATEQEQREIQVGDVVQIGSQCVIVVETQDDEVTLKICNADDLDDFPSEWRGPAAKK